MEFLIHPALIFLIGSFLLMACPRICRLPLLVMIPLLSLLAIIDISHSHLISYINDWHVVGITLKPWVILPYSTLFALAFTLVAFAAGIYAYYQKSAYQTALGFAYTAGALVVCYMGDFITMILSFEWMALCATGLIISGGYPNSLRSGARYLAMHLFAGTLLLAGIAGHILITGNAGIESINLPFAQIFSGMGISSLDCSHLILAVGLLIHIAAPPFCAWVADSYPESSPVGFLYVTSLTTKAALFATLLIFSGAEWLIPLGVTMLAYGTIYAIISNDIRRILSYSLIVQLGLMMIAIGIGTTVALHAAVLLALVHLCYNCLFGMIMGTVITATGKHKLTDMGGLYRSMQLMALFAVISSFTMAALPGTFGYIAKALLLQSAQEVPCIWLVLVILAASASSVFHGGFRLTWMVFFDRDAGYRDLRYPAVMLIPAAAAAFLCLLLGTTPSFILQYLPQPMIFTGYQYGHWYNQAQLYVFAIIAFFITYPLLKPTKAIILDFDWFYRKCIRHFLLLGEQTWLYLMRFGKNWSVMMLSLSGRCIRHIAQDQGILARNYPIGMTVLSLTVMLGVYLFLYYR